MDDLLTAFENWERAKKINSPYEPAHLLTQRIFECLEGVHMQLKVLITQLEWYNHLIHKKHGVTIDKVLVTVRASVEIALGKKEMITENFIENLSAIHELAKAWSENRRVTKDQDDPSQKWRGHAYQAGIHTSKTLSASDEGWAVEGHSSVSPGLIRGTSRPSKTGGI